MRFGLPKIAFKKHLSTLFIAVVIMHLGDYVIIPILPVLLINRGLRPDQIGFIIAVGALSFQIGSIIGGFISDRIGRKTTLIIGSIIEVCALLGFGLSSTYSLFILFQILNGFGGGLYAPTVKAAIAEYAEDSTDARTTAFSIRGMAANLGIAVGGLIPLLVMGLKFRTYFFIAAAIYLILLLLSIFYISNRPNDRNYYGKITLKHYLSILKNKPFLIFSALTIFIWIIYAQLSLLLPLRASSIFENGKIVGSIWTITSLVVVLFQTLIVSHVIRKIHTLQSIALGTFVMGSGIFLIGFSNSYLVLLISGIIFIVGEMLITPTIDCIISELADKEIIGAYFSVANIIFGIGFALGSYISGKLIKTYGIVNSLEPWYIILISSGVVAIIFYLSIKITSMKDISD